MINKELIDKFGKHIINAEASFDQEQFCVINSAFKEFCSLVEKDVEKQIKDALFYYLDIETPCPACGGRGKRTYSSTATWHGGIGGQMITTGICDKCWGSGEKDRPWTNLRILRELLTKEQQEKYSKLTNRGI